MSSSFVGDERGKRRWILVVNEEVLIVVRVDRVTKRAFKLKKPRDEARQRVERSVDSSEENKRPRVNVLDVIAVLPQDGPSITGEEKVYATGDVLGLNCTSGKSHPAATLKWFINREQVRETPGFRSPRRNFEKRNRRIGFCVFAGVMVDMSRVIYFSTARKL